MRLIPVLTVAACLCASGALFAQEWTEFASREDQRRRRADSRVDPGSHNDFS